MPYILILTFSALFLITGCTPAPKAAMHPKLASYQSLQNGCKKNQPALLEQECTLFLSDLEAENVLLQKMQQFEEDEKGQSG